MYWSAVLCIAALRIPRITALGLRRRRRFAAVSWPLSRRAVQIEKDVGVGNDVVGFDTGEGMPAASDYRDLPHIWSKGFYKMDQD